MHHDAKNRFILTDCSSAFNTVRRTAVVTEAAMCVPALKPFVTKCYGEISAPVSFQIDSREKRKL